MSDYHEAQASKFDKHHGPGIGLPRKKAFVDLILQNIDKNSVKGVLLIGCSNSDEKTLFEKAGFPVIGIDLFPSDGIEKMDMHELRFEDGSFDLVVFSHSFEHAEDPKKVLREIKRVLRPGGYIALEVPVHFKTNSIDRWDFQNWHYLAINISGIIPSITIFGRNYPIGTEGNYCGTDCVKLIVRRK
jgi:SAM-dependent methyltransferase